MTKKHLPKILIPLVILLVAVGAYYLITSLTDDSENSNLFSGTIEAVSSVISPEIGGRVSEVFVNEGDQVETGEPLFYMDASLLLAQQAVAQEGLLTAQKAASTAQAAVATAQANLDLVLAAARQESTAIRAEEWQSDNLQGYTLPGGSFTQAELINAAQTEVENAIDLQNKAENDLQAILDDSGNSDFVKSEQELLELKLEAQSAKDVLTKASTSNNRDLRDEAQELYDDVLDRLKDAQSAYDDLVDTDSAQRVLTARNSLQLASERVQAAQTRLASLQTGENSLKVTAAQAALDQARAAADQAAQAVAQAESSLALVDVQLGKLTVLAPFDGLVMSRAVEVGEVMSPGAPAITLGQVDTLTITVYVPETEVGSISIDQPATLTVDSFPGEEFQATVIHIADRAEFTPRNVQTTEGRMTTVFAVKLQITDPDGKLKPGMPADVSFK